MTEPMTSLRHLCDADLRTTDPATRRQAAATAALTADQYHDVMHLINTKLLPGIRKISAAREGGSDHGDR